MLKFDEINVPEDATSSPGYTCELLNSKPSVQGLHQTKGTQDVCVILARHKCQQRRKRDRHRPGAKVRGANASCLTGPGGAFRCPDGQTLRTRAVLNRP